MMTRRGFLNASVAGTLTLASGGVAEAGQTAAAERGQTRASSPTAPSKPPAQVEQAWAMLGTLSQSSNLQRRRYAASGYALLASGNSRALGLVTKMLSSDKDPELRSFAASSLGQERVRASIPALRRSLNDPATAVAFAAAKSLWDMKDRSGAVVFREVLMGERKDSTGMITGYMNDARRRMHDPKGLAVLGINEAVGAFLGPAGMALSFAEQNFKDKGAPGRALAAGILAGDPSSESKKELESALQDSSPVVRAAACRSLAVIGDTSSIPLIESLFDDKNDAARAMASAAYLQLWEKQTVRRSRSRGPKKG